ncbi:AraC family transcriptional regulator [Ramlibacter sp. WS9]|uniref:helix-turn-helix domain-containing protein n=1 Tax=Ramlibacter sp. WS9 TaxID=1882741 RepID=UPI001144C2E4|nr:AraC family transcriptional regulator [Ramlibacter sp. WS9]ROZ78954.1 AraC family transcriptional regulator [Ramlibacter sp. WS9]
MDTARSLLSLRTYGASHGSHAHDHFQALVGVDGVLELEIEGRGLRIAKGDAFLVSPGERHDFEARGGSRCLVLDTDLPLWSGCRTRPERPQTFRPLAQYLAQALAQDQPLAALHGPALLLEAWRPAGAEPRARRPIDWNKLAEWAQVHMRQPVTVADLANQVFLSASQLTQRCHEMHGMAPMHWLRTQRLAHARQLRDSGLAVAEVARRTGYRSPSALTAALRRFLPH